MIPAMTQLRTVIWMVGCMDRRSLVEIRRFVKAFMAEHGERGRELDMDVAVLNLYHWTEACVFNELRKELMSLFRELGPFPPGRTVIDNSYDWARSLEHVDTTDFNHVRDICIETNSAATTIMSRCPRLETLRLHSEALTWRAFKPFSDARRAQDGPCPNVPVPKPAQVSCIPPLRSVDLVVRTNGFTYFVNDLAFAFGTTLEEIKLQVGEGLSGVVSLTDSVRFRGLTFKDDGTVVCRLRTVRWTYPQLRRLSIEYGDKENVHFKIHGDMDGMPKLRELSIVCQSPAIGTRSSFILEDTISDFPRLRESALLKLPELHSLTLKGAVAAQYNPASLKWSPNLHQLNLCMSPVIGAWGATSRVQSAWKDVVKSWSGPLLSSLTKVELGGHAIEWVCLPTLLRVTPALKHLALDRDQALEYDFSTSIPIDQVLFGNRPQAADGSIGPPVVFDKLQSLTVGGDWELDKQAYKELLLDQWAPGLESLKFTMVPFELLTWLVTTACEHQSLRKVRVERILWFYMEPDKLAKYNEDKKRALKTIGFLEFDEDEFDKVESDPFYVFFDFQSEKDSRNARYTTVIVIDLPAINGM